jgi:hypothetical protein
MRPFRRMVSEDGRSTCPTVKTRTSAAAAAKSARSRGAIPVERKLRQRQYEPTRPIISRAQTTRGVPRG